MDAESAHLYYFNPPAPCGTGRSRSSLTTSTNGISIHPPLAGRDCSQREYMTPHSLFQSTRPLRDGTNRAILVLRSCCISIHPPLAGRDAVKLSDDLERMDISIHPPLAGRDDEKDYITRYEYDISIHPPLAGRDVVRSVEFDVLSISIHPPLAGRDRIPLVHCFLQRYFNPPAPCGTGPRGGDKLGQLSIFQSTRPLRDGTGQA